MKRSIRYGAMAAALFAAGLASADVTVYRQQGLRGPSLDIRGATRDLEGSGFYDNISSIEVHSGRWEFCSRPNFRGDCRVLDPGRYSALPQVLNHRIESIRPEGARSEGGVAYHERGWPYHPAVELYAAPGFRGPSVTLDRNVRNLDRRGTGDRVSSMIVREGTWELCTEPRFNGRCRTYGPGQYPRLGWRMDDNVSSLRRVG
jgi:hypothetical protein